MIMYLKIHIQNGASAASKPVSRCTREPFVPVTLNAVKPATRSAGLDRALREVLVQHSPIFDVRSMSVKPVSAANGPHATASDCPRDFARIMGAKLPAKLYTLVRGSRRRNPNTSLIVYCWMRGVRERVEKCLLRRHSDLCCVTFSTLLAPRYPRGVLKHPPEKP